MPRILEFNFCHSFTTHRSPSYFKQFISTLYPHSPVIFLLSIHIESKLYSLNSLNFQPALFHLRLYSSLYSLYSPIRNLMLKSKFFPYFSPPSSTLSFFILPPSISPSFLCFLPIVFLLLFPHSSSRSSSILTLILLLIFPSSSPPSSPQYSPHSSPLLPLIFLLIFPLIFPLLLLALPLILPRSVLLFLLSLFPSLLILFSPLPPLILLFNLPLVFPSSSSRSSPHSSRSTPLIPPLFFPSSIFFASFFILFFPLLPIILLFIPPFTFPSLIPSFFRDVFPSFFQSSSPHSSPHFHSHSTKVMTFPASQVGPFQLKAKWSLGSTIHAFHNSGSDPPLCPPLTPPPPSPSPLSQPLLPPYNLLKLKLAILTFLYTSMQKVSVLLFLK